MGGIGTDKRQKVIGIAKRIITLFVVLWLISSVEFLLFRVLPEHSIVPRTNNPYLIDLIRSEYHLEMSLTEQYLWHIWNTLTLDFGISSTLFRAQNIADYVVPSLERSLWLFSVVFILTLLAGMAYEATASTLRNRIPRMTMRLAALLLLSAPAIGFAMLVLDLNLRLGASLPFHSSPYSTAHFGEGDDWDRLYYNISHGILPVATCILLTFGFISLFYRGEAAQGSSLRNIWREMGRVLGSMRDNPWMTKFFFAWILSSVLVVDVFFNYHGLGTLLWDSTSARDFPFIMALFFILAAILAISNAAFDVLSIALPRKAVVPPDIGDSAHELLPMQAAKRESLSLVVSAKGICVAYRRSKAGVAAFAVFVAMALIALAAPLLSTVQDPANPNNYEFPVLPDRRNPLPPSIDPSPYTGYRHPLGTDGIGMDVYSAMLYGSREPVMACLTIGVLSLVLGFLAGLVGAALPPTKGPLTKVFSWLADTIADTFVAIPLFMMIFGLFFDQRWGFWVATVLVVPIVFLWAAVFVARQIRHESAVHDSAAGRRKRTVRGMLPTILARALHVTKVIVIIGVLTLIAVDLFWGLISMDRTNWGQMIEGALMRDAVIEGAWWWYIPPIIGVCVLLTSSFVILDTLERIVRKGEGTAGAVKAPSPTVTVE